MKRLFYGVAVSALVLGTGGLAVACEQHAKMTSLENPAGATRAAATVRGFVLAQAQPDQGSATSEDDKEKKPEAAPPTIGPQAGAEGGLIVAQSQDGDKSTTGEESKEKPDESK